MRHVLLVSLLSWFAPLAMSTALPDEYRGVWGSPTCVAPKETLVFLRNAYVWIGQDESDWVTLERPEGEKKQWLVLNSPSGFHYFFQRTDDNALLEAFAPDNADPKATQPGDDWETLRYEACLQGLPASTVLLHGEAIAFLQMIDAVKASCGDDVAQCSALLFAGVDVSGDARLSRAELARLFRVGAYLSLLSDQEATLNSDLMAAVGAALALGPILASAIVNSLDYDNDGVLSLEEISQDRSALVATLQNPSDQLGPRIDGLKGSVKQLEKLLKDFMR
jgi:hypothetical protein